MIASLMIDPDDSVDFPGNTATALGRPLAAYPFIATRASAQIQRQYVMTASLPVKSVALQNDAVIIDPPPSDSGSRAPQEMLVHGLRLLRQELKGEKEALELVCVFLSNAPTVTPDLLNAGLDAMLARPELDAAISVSPHRRWNPNFARRETREGLLEPFFPSVDGNLAENWWYPDWSLQLLRPRCLDSLDSKLALPWLSGRVLPLKQWGGCPVDYQWQIPAVEYWLKKHGFSDLTPTFELQPKPQPAPAPRDGRR